VIKTILIIMAAAIVGMFLAAAEFGSHEPPHCEAGSSAAIFTNCKH
jgi:hypothetical protein